MKTQTPFPRIFAKIYGEPWCILPVNHAAIRFAFGKHCLPVAAQADALEDGGDEGHANPQPFFANGIAVVPVHGLIGKHLSLLEMACGGVDVDTVAAAVDAAVADPQVEKVVLWFNSAGGTVTGVPEVAQRIAAAAKIKPVIAFTDSICASAAYWLASQCSAVYTTESATIGSVGVYTALLDESARLESEGVKINAISAGEHKLEGASFRPLADSERARIQSGVDKIFARFVAAIHSVRPQIMADAMQGQCFDGEDAVAAGISDGVVLSLSEIL